MKAKKIIGIDNAVKINERLADIFSRSNSEELGHLLDGTPCRHLAGSYSYRYYNNATNCYVACSGSGKASYYAVGDSVYFEGTRGAFNGCPSDAEDLISEFFTSNNDWEVIDSIVPAECGTDMGALVVEDYPSSYNESFILISQLPPAEQAKIKTLDKNAQVYAFFDNENVYLIYNNKLL